MLIVEKKLPLISEMNNMITPFTAEQDQYRQITEMKSYYIGLREGVARFAHWKDGVQYVGTTGKTLKKAIEEINIEESSQLAKYDNLMSKFGWK
jgi:hypothetical protein